MLMLRFVENPPYHSCRLVVIMIEHVVLMVKHIVNNF